MSIALTATPDVCGGRIRIEGTRAQPKFGFDFGKKKDGEAMENQ